MSSSRVPAARVVGPYLQPLLDACAAQGIERTRLATTAGLPAGLLLRPLDELPVAHYVQLLQAASVLAGDRGFGLRMAEFVRPGTYGVLGISLLSCATLGQALQQVLKYEALVHDLGTSQLQTLPEGVCRFVWHNCADSALLVDAVFAGMLVFAQWLSGRPLPLLAVELASPVLPLPDYAAFYRAPVRQGPENAFCFAAELLQWRLPQAEPSLLPMLDAWAARLLAARQGPEAELLRVRQVLRAALPEILTVAEVAARLHVSPRTLQRRLQEAGSHFLAELERVRRELAEDYVRHSALGITEIALLLGYREASSFSHAFRGWLGMSPQQFRRQR